MRVRTIKNVDDETWKLIRTIARREKLKMSDLLKDMAREYTAKPSAAWSKILNVKPILTSKEANEMKKIVKEIRHEYGFRK